MRVGARRCPAETVLGEAVVVSQLAHLPPATTKLFTCGGLVVGGQVGSGIKARMFGDLKKSKDYDAGGVCI